VNGVPENVPASIVSVPAFANAPVVVSDFWTSKLPEFAVSDASALDPPDVICDVPVPNVIVAAFVVIAVGSARVPPLAMYVPPPRVPSEPRFVRLVVFRVPLFAARLPLFVSGTPIVELCVDVLPVYESVPPLSFTSSFPLAPSWLAQFPPSASDSVPSFSTSEPLQKYNTPAELLEP
jgi:hypothetical protein